MREDEQRQNDHGIVLCKHEGIESNENMARGLDAYRYTFTVFTATYNRELTLPRVYESLRQQTFRDFEWLIVDDGSTDGTGQLVRSWQRDSAFPIRYFWQQNHGKLAAVNNGVREAKGQLFLILDSDDACFPWALERFKYHWNSIPEAERHAYSAVTALCVNERGEIVGKRFPRDVTNSDSLEIRYRYKVTGEKWGFHRTDVLRQFPFPEVRGEAYVPESVIWRAISRQYRTRFVNEPLRTYFQGEDGTSEQHLAGWSGAMKHARGAVLSHASILNEDIDWLSCAPTAFFRSALHYSRFSFHAGIRVRGQAWGLLNSRARILWAIMLPFGFAVFLSDRWRRGPNED